MAETPKSADEFTTKLNEFRQADTGAFLLVGRYDGIDLPDDDCRVMVVDGVPVGSSQLERFLFERIRLDQTFFPRVANRLTQLFGRINRGKNDYGIYIIHSKDVENWLRNVANQAYFPKVLQEQIGLSEQFCEQLGDVTFDDIHAIVRQIIDRDPNWLEYYQAHLGQNPIEERRITEREAHTKLDDKLAKKEANFILKLWHGDNSGAIAEFESVVEEVRQENPRLAGWYSIWLGAANCFESEHEAMYDWFDEARNRLGGTLPLPRRSSSDVAGVEATTNVLEDGLRPYCVGSIPETNRRLTKLIDRTHAAFEDDSYSRAEEAIREIGVALGFDSSRPDTDVNDGPDNLWVDKHQNIAIPIELKTEKKDGNSINSDEIGQVFQHFQWTIDNYPDYEVPGILVYTECSSVTESSNPSDEMFYCDREAMQKLFSEYKAIISDIAKLTPVERYARAAQLGNETRWTSRGIFERLVVGRMKVVG
ncbi:helicase C-terminal domain-containing protein [Roseibium sediminicola]|uniref:ATP-dependent helicase C-terminal domain-containing protein n=1 Tax=Roseibium sediminicola TaxID=2933272 RepID=A0ABT0H0K8_9HYPH|nr:helicase C-terminal domain-containing protein [Roseibium sp. CAU 1639]MCK7615226.1 hypothetical protein [Roseibium sp. CAU 1639]